MNDVPARPRPPTEPGQAEPSAGAERSSIEQTRLSPTDRRFGEGLPTDGPNGQSSTPMRIARPSDPGATPGLVPGVAPLGAEETEGRVRAVPDGRPATRDGLAGDADSGGRHERGAGPAAGAPLEGGG
jgi:hypothetical protein